NRTVTHAICAQNQTIQDHLHIIQQAGIEPTMISVDSMVLFNIQQYLQHQAFSTYAIVDIGHTKTSLCIISNQQLAFVRTLYTAGQEINEHIFQQLDLTMEQAIEVKEKHGIIETDFKPLQSKDLKKLSNAIQSVIDPLFREILQSFHMYRSQNFLTKEQKAIEHVFFCGGTSNIRNLSHYFTALVNVPASVIDLSNTGIDLDSSACAKFATSMGAALKFASRSKLQLPKDMINYRKGPYSLAQDYGQYKDKGIYYAKWFSVFFVLLCILFIFKNQSMKHQYENIEKAAIKSFQQYVPEQKVKSSKTAVKSLKAKVTELEQKKELLTSGLDQMTALGVLREISTRIPSQIKIDTQEISIDQNKVTLRGVTNSYASVDQIIQYLESVPFFERIEKGNMQEKEDKQIQFQLTIVIGATRSEEQGDA
ncbi:MAG: pilus assembly protein PilM, partial [Deltaproteobacteria bacterium]|nr:pilus assembly protein PilM [Deltaproteobacteria bacterium]